MMPNKIIITVLKLEEHNDKSNIYTAGYACLWKNEIPDKLIFRETIIPSYRTLLIPYVIQLQILAFYVDDLYPYHTIGG